jgi:hypothetical protein
VSDTEHARILQALEAACWVVQGPNGAAVRLGLHPATLIYRMKRLNIARPRVATRSESHPPAAVLTVELAKLRRHARMLATNYLPTPARAAMLRANELEQRAVRAKLRGILCERPVAGGVRGSPAPGALRPAWAQRW